PVDVALPTIEVRDVALRPGLYGGPTRAHLDVRVDQGRLRVSTHLQLLEHGVGVATNLRARRLPLGRTRLYVPKVGWRELAGDLGGGGRDQCGGHGGSGTARSGGRAPGKAVAVVRRLAQRDRRARARARRRGPDRRRRRARGARAERRR